MVRFRKYSRGFTTPIMVTGFILVGILGLVGIINLFRGADSTSQTASQTTQSTEIQKIEEDTPTPAATGTPAIEPLVDNSASSEKFNWIRIGYSCVQVAFVGGGYPTKEACEKKEGVCRLPGGNDSYIFPCEVTESTPSVRVNTNNLPDPKEGFQFFYCLKNSLTNCSASDWKPFNPDNHKLELTDLCADGSKGLKTKNSCKQDGSNWFRAGTTYRIFIAQGTNKPISPLYPLGTKAEIVGNVVRTVSFYAKHFYPQITAPINSNATKPVNLPGSNISRIKETQTLSIPVKLLGRNDAGGKIGIVPGTTPQSDQFNDYYVQVFSRDNDYVYPNNTTRESTCLYVSDSGSGEITLNLPSTYLDSSGNDVTLSEGSYVLRIYDGAGGYPDHNHPTCDPANFVYYDIPFSIGAGQDGQIGPAVTDPYSKETGITEAVRKIQPVCGTNSPKDPNGYCTTIDTALGPIHTEPKAFIGDIFKLVLSIGGIAAIVFFIQAGYTLMTSAGNKEKVGQAREQITAAILGLIFIILSTAILEFIGIKILQLPGFGN